jgi:hypothetical protein
MSAQNDTPKVTEGSGNAAPDRGRRRLLHGGLGAAPVLMTLVSRPVLGRTNQCFSPSGFVSMPTSQDRQPQFCQGRTPGFWRQPQKFNQWPEPFYPTTTSGPGGHQATKFVDWFSPTVYDLNFTFLDAVKLPEGPPNNVTRHIVAAMLNVYKGWAPVLTKESLQNMWWQYASTGAGLAGYFEPTAGVKWYHDEITAYLESTMLAE